MKSLDSGVPTSGAEALRAEVDAVAPGTKLDVDELARRYGLESRYVRRLLKEMENALIYHAGKNDYTRMANDVPYASPDDLLRSYEGRPINQDKPGRVINSKPARPLP